MNDSTSYSCSRTPAWAIILAVLIGGFCYIAGQKAAAIEAHFTPPTINVSGEGKVSAPPDIASLSFGVQTGQKPTAKEAIATLSKQMNAVVDAMHKAQVADKDITTEQFSLSPTYDWSTGSQRITGYTASQMLGVKVHNLDTTADVLSAATSAGANQAGEVAFTIDDPEKARSEARAKALTQAKEKAQTIAAQLGMSLSKITSYSEGGNGYSPPMPMRAMAGVAMDAKAEAVPLPAGDQEVNVTVSLTYELR